MKLVKFFFILLFFLSFKVNANNLIAHLREFFQLQYSLNTSDFTELIHTPFKIKQIFKKPCFLLKDNLNNFHLFNILYAYKKQHECFDAKVQIKGKYIIAKKKILRGTKIKESDLKVITGRLDKLPHGAYLRKQDVIDRVNLRDILPFQPITSFMTRAFWIIKVNQEVTIKFKGINFEIITTGKALGNGVIDEKVRAQIKNNKIVTGIINKHGEVVVILLS
ncbi:flagellar basal body P-ring formation chaperone FlgA [Buchnera aphidicola]|uniref:Flagella basal body P-ring formation protein FlgA n=1 Tax=Buchnera aphidicola (Aphis aurantii) TaxID=1470492 RepID=A0AAU6W6F1_9GAMM